MTELAFFEPALEDLQDALPEWWAGKYDGELATVLAVVGSVFDDLAAIAEGIYADQALDTARDGALRTEWALLYGAENEQLPLDTETLRAYLKERAFDDGTVEQLQQTLLAILRNATNDVGTPAQFPEDGSGLALPIGPLFEPTNELAGLEFPINGSGLTFPADGSGLTFPDNPRLTITEVFSEYRLDVTVREILAFDRPAFARAVQRARMAHQVPPTITEV